MLQGHAAETLFPRYRKKKLHFCAEERKFARLSPVLHIHLRLNLHFYRKVSKDQEEYGVMFACPLDLEK